MIFMKYRILIDVSVKTEAEAKKIYDCVTAKKDKFLSVSKMERWKANYHKCYHDEPINRPCELIEEIKDKEAEQRSIR